MLGVNPTTTREENDFYATNPKALRLLLEQLKEENIMLDKNIWECACGMGHLSKVLLAEGYNVLSTDLIKRGYGEQEDFLNSERNWEGDILTNPPFKYAEFFIDKGMKLLKDNKYLILFVKIQFLEQNKLSQDFGASPNLLKREGSLKLEQERV